MRNLLSLFKRNRRRGDERESVRRRGYLFQEGRLLGGARIIDESEGGFRIAPEMDPQSVPDAMTLLEVETAVAHEVEVVWRGSEQAGVRVVSEQRLRGFVPAHYQVLKTFWEQAAVLTA